MALALVCLILVLLTAGFCQSPTSSTGSQEQVTAFTKGQTANLHLSKGEKISFNKRITIVGSNFDGDGSFVCQTPGLYAFSFYALTESDWELWVEMVKNDHELIASIYAYTYDDYADAGNSAILHLDVGDKISIKTHDNYDQTLYGASDEIYTTFTGELLYADAKELDTINSYGAVGFHSVMTVNTSISDGSAVIFDKVITNIGNGYDSKTGTFTAPVDGTYVFHYYSLAHSGEETWLELYENNNYAVALYGYTPGSYADSGNTVLLHLKQNDRVQIKARNGHDIKLFGDSDEYYTTFSGALLSPTVQAAAAGPGVVYKPEIAFSVGLTHNEGSTNGNKVVFDRVFVNLGQKFDLNTGVFTSPVSGIYVFHYHALAQYGRQIWMELKHNYKYINSIYSHTNSSYGPGSNSAAIEMIQGDTVYLDIGNHNSFLYGAGDEIYCTFSGYLLAPLPDYHPVVG